MGSRMSGLIKDDDSPEAMENVLNFLNNNPSFDVNGSPACIELPICLKDGDSLLHWACRQKNGATVVRLLLERNASVSGRNHSKWTPLHIASELDAGAVAMVLEHKADIDCCNEDGDTPLILAAKSA